MIYSLRGYPGSKHDLNLRSVKDMIAVVNDNVRQKRVLPLVLLMSIIGAAGCSKPMARSRVVRVYEAEHENGTETLRLLDDGSYSHRFKASNGSESTISDKWEFAPNGASPSVVLHNFAPHFPGNSWIRGAWSLGIKEDYGLIRLYLSYDPRQFYLELPNK